MNQPDFAKEYVGLTDEQLSQMKVADLVPEAQRAHAEELRRRASPEFQETRLHEEDLERARIAKLGADAAFMTTQSPWTEVAALPQTDPKAGMRKTMRGGALIWPQMCCCGGDTTGLERTRVVSQKQKGGRIV